MSLPPFGSPDGSHLPESDILGLHDGVLAPLLKSPRSRVIVARSGAGKTCFLRRVRMEMTKRAHGALVTDIQTSAPASADVAGIDSRFARGQQSVVWAQIWRAAIVRSFATEVMCAPERYGLTDLDELALRHSFSGLLRRAEECFAPKTVWSQVHAIVDKTRTGSELRAYLDQDAWGDLERHLITILEQSGPVVLPIDLLDEYVSHMPRAWTACQHGLLAAVDGLQASEFGRWLHVFVTTREHHFIQLTHEDPRSALREHVLALEVNEEEAKAFCVEKVRQTGRGAASGSVPGGAMTTLLGFNEIDNPDRGCTEPALDYLVRHTRSLPRDIVVLGNDLLRNQRPDTPTQAPLDEEWVRKVVRGCARLYGQEQLNACARQLAITLSQEDAASEHIMSTTSTPGGADHPRLRQRLERFIDSIGRERVGRAELEHAREGARDEFAIDVLDVLWHNSLLGHVPASGDPARPFFFSLRSSDTTLPDSPEYVFHPCLIDTIGLDHGGPGSNPIVPVIERDSR